MSQKALLAVLTSDHRVVSSSAPLLLSYNYFFKPLSSVLSTVLQARLFFPSFPLSVDNVGHGI